MQRRTFLSSALGRVAGVLPRAAGRAAPERPHREPSVAQPAPIPDYWEPLLTVTLAGGRAIRLEKIAARRTYLSMISGRPDDSIQQHTLDELKDFSKRVLDVEDSIIIPPAIVAREHAGEVWTEYPPAFVAALFFSIGGARRGGMFSELAVGWFQPRLHPLMPDDILAAIQKLDWTNLACDVWW